MGLALLAAPGCSGSPGGAPRLQPDAAAKQALAEYDQNKDGFLDAKELERSPALKNVAKELDWDGDGKLSTRELSERLATYLEGPMAPFAFECAVTLDKRPLAGATVTLIPEKFLGPTFAPASGVTDDSGRAMPRVEGQQSAGVFAGLYRIEVSKKNAQGQETLPARYNAKTTLGQEVSPQGLGRGGDLPLSLTSK